MSPKMAAAHRRFKEREALREAERALDWALDDLARAEAARAASCKRVEIAREQAQTTPGLLKHLKKEERSGAIEARDTEETVERLAAVRRMIDAIE